MRARVDLYKFASSRLKSQNTVADFAVSVHAPAFGKLTTITVYYNTKIYYSITVQKISKKMHYFWH